TVLLVSHDRVFLNNVVTQTIVSEPGAHWQEYAGGYDDWVQQSQTQPLTPSPEGSSSATAPTHINSAEPSEKVRATSKRSSPARSNRLTSWEVKELDAIPTK